MSGNHPFGKLSVLDVKWWDSDALRPIVKASIPIELASTALQAMREFNSELSEPDKVEYDLEVRKYGSLMYFFGRNFDIVKDSMRYTDERLRAEQ